jgi:hypothetical protein
MHLQAIRAMCDDRRRELTRAMAASRRGPRRHLPRLSVSWTRAGAARGGSVMIAISAIR